MAKHVMASYFDKQEEAEVNELKFHIATSPRSGGEEDCKDVNEEVEEEAEVVVDEHVEKDAEADAGEKASVTAASAFATRPSNESGPAARRNSRSSSIRPSQDDMPDLSALRDCKVSLNESSRRVTMKKIDQKKVGSRARSATASDADRQSEALKWKKKKMELAGRLGKARSSVVSLREACDEAKALKSKKKRKEELARLAELLTPAEARLRALQMEMDGINFKLMQLEGDGESGEVTVSGVPTKSASEHVKADHQGAERARPGKGFSQRQAAAAGNGGGGGGVSRRKGSLALMSSPRERKTSIVVVLDDEEDLH